MLAGPIIASMISRTVMSFVDFVMVSALGTEAQAAIMPAQILLFCVISFGMGVLSVTNAFVAQALGRGDRAECSAYGWQGVWLSAAMAVLALPAWWGVPGFFAWIGHEPAVQAMEIDYVRIGILGFFPMLAAVALSNFFTGVHKPSVAFWTALAANGFNVAGNFALIYGYWGFPKMGIAGAAVATQLAAALQTLLLVAWMLRPHFAHTYHTLHTWRPNWTRMRRIVTFGVPAGAQFTVDILAFTIFTLFLVGQFGTTQLAAHNLAFKFLEVSFMPTVGLGVAVTAAVGKAIGADDRRHARRVTRWGAGMGVAYMGLIAVGYLTLRHPMIALLTDDAGVAAWAAKILLLCAVFQVFDALGIVHMHALRGAGDNLWPALVGAGYAATVFITGGWFVATWFPQWDALGPWACATLYISLLGTTLWARWKFGPWERIEMLQPSVPAAVSA